MVRLGVVKAVKPVGSYGHISKLKLITDSLREYGDTRQWWNGRVDSLSSWQETTVCD